MTTTQPVVKRALLAACVAALTACSSSNADLDAYIDEIKARRGGRIEPLPQIRPAPSFVYEPGDRRSPFVPDTPQERGPNPSGVQPPDPDRPREFLERFSLDTLRMVGTLEREGTRFALVQDSDGLLHRVTVGNYIGQNYGRITSISDSEVAVVEIIADGLGGYLERPAAIALSD